MTSGNKPMCSSLLFLPDLHIYKNRCQENLGLSMKCGWSVAVSYSEGSDLQLEVSSDPSR